VVVAASFTLGLSCLGPYANAGLLDGGDSDSSIEGLPLPVGGDALGLLDGGLLEGDLLGGLLALPLGLLEGGLPLGVLGDGGLPLGVLGDGGLPLGVLGDDGLPLVGDVLEEGPLGLLGGEEGGLLAAEGVVELVPDLSFVPGLGSVSEILEAFSDSGSIVPGLQVLDEFGILGILGSM
jgi:hypothetical protein